MNGRGGRVVKDRALSIVGNLQFILLLTWWKMWVRGDVDNGWRFEISRSFLLSRTCSAVPSCPSLLILGTYTYSIRFGRLLRPETSLLHSCRLSSAGTPRTSVSDQASHGWLPDFMKKSLFRLLGLIANNGASQCCVVAAV